MKVSILFAALACALSVSALDMERNSQADLVARQFNDGGRGGGAGGRGGDGGQGGAGGRGGGDGGQGGAGGRGGDGGQGGAGGRGGDGGQGGAGGRGGDAGQGGNGGRGGDEGSGGSGGHYGSGGGGHGGVPGNNPVPSHRPRAAPRAVAVDLPLGERDDAARCPTNRMACPISQIAPEDVTFDTPWECVSYEEDLYSCGGCTTLGTGIDCTALTGVKSVSCAAATCAIHSCASGYALFNNTCTPALLSQ